MTMFTEELPWLSEQDQELIMGQAVCAWWGGIARPETPVRSQPLPLPVRIRRGAMPS